MSILLRGIVLINALILFSGCSTQPEHSTWGEIIQIAEAHQSAAPALLVDENRAITSWIGDDERGVHHDARQIDGTIPGEPVTLPLPPVHPYDQFLLPGESESTHLLWLDANTQGETRLYSALLSPDLQVERGPTEISSAQTYDFAAVPGSRGSIWAAWAEGQAAFPTLYLGSIDALGRPQAPAQLATNAERPAMAYASDGTVYLFWLSENSLVRARLIDGAVLDTTALTSRVAVRDGDRLHDLRAGIDNTFGYVFWNITRANGENQTWMATGRLDAAVWQPPRPLIDVEGTPMTWASSHILQAETLSIAGQFGGNLAVFGFENGTLQTINVIVEHQPLLAPPSLVLDNHNQLALAWSLPRPNSPALLLFTRQA